MSKLDLLKKSLLTIRETLKRYETLIPGTQKHRYEKDIAMIFNNLDDVKEEQELNRMDKLAKTKLKSIQRIYGVLREESTSESKKFSFIDEETENLLHKTFGVNPKEPFRSKFNEIKNSPAFNPELVKQYQQDYFEEKKRIEEAYMKVMQEKEDEKLKSNQKTVENILTQGKEFDFSKCRDKEGNLVLNKLKEAVKEIMRMNGFPDADQRAEEYDYTSLMRQMNDEGQATVPSQQKEIEKQIDSMDVSNTKKTEELFSVFSEKKNVSEEDLNKYTKKIKPILEDKNLSDTEKQKLVLEETRKAEDEWNRKNLDGFISVDKYGEFKFEFYKKAKEEHENKSNDSIENNADSSKEESNTGVKNFVWRDGKLVEGKAKERKVVTYSNWHAGHHNPDDLRKHRELLDRQHYGGPLWEGIKYKGMLTDKKDIVITGPTKEDLAKLEKNQINIPETSKENKTEIIEVIR